MNDRYIDQRMFPELLYYLSQLSASRGKKMVETMMKKNVNVERSLNFLYQSQTKASAAQEEQQVAQATEAAADSTAPVWWTFFETIIWKQGLSVGIDVQNVGNPCFI